MHYVPRIWRFIICQALPMAGLLVCGSVLGQHNNNWALGFKTGITFNTSPPSIIQTGIIADTNSHGEARVSSSYSNCKGELIVYSSGRQLWNKKHLPLKNGAFYKHDKVPNYGSSSIFSSPIIRMPGSDRYLYYFYVIPPPDDCGKWLSAECLECGKMSLQYAVIDLQGDNGLGEVVIRNRVLDKNMNAGIGTAGGNITFAYHSNKRDIWMIQGPGSTIAKAYLLTDTGVRINPVVSFNVFSGNFCEVAHNPATKSSYFKTEPRQGGHFKMTHDGKNLIVSGIDSSTTSLGCCLMYDFDQSTGKLNNPKTLLDFNDAAQLQSMFPGYPWYGNYYFNEIATNDTFIYFVGNSVVMQPAFYTTKIMQVNRFTLSKQMIYNQPRSHFIGLQIGPDGIIYSRNWFKYRQPQLISIPKANQPGLNARVLKTGIIDSNDFYTDFPANFPPYYRLYNSCNLKANPCADTAVFEVFADREFRELKVFFGDGDSMVYTSPIQPSYKIRHVYHQTGTYYFRATGLNPHCDYFTRTFDTVQVARAQQRFALGRTAVPGCTEGEIQLKDSFINADFAVYDWGAGKKDTFKTQGDFDARAWQKTYNSKDSTQLVYWRTAVYGKICKTPVVYADSLFQVFLPAAVSVARIERLSAGWSRDTFKKPLFIACQSLALSFIDSSPHLQKGNLHWNNVSQQYNSPDLLKQTFKPGFYESVFYDTSTYGCTSSDTFYVQVHPRPHAEWAWPNTSLCFKGHVFSAIPQASGITGGVHYRLYWGDGDSAIMDSSKSLLHTYAGPGTYRPALFVESTKGCIDHIDTVVTVLADIKAAFSVDVDSQCLDKNQFVFRRADTAHTLNQWQWGDNDSSVNTGMQPVTHTYTGFGNFMVRHITHTGLLCADTAAIQVTVLEMPAAGFSISDTLFCINNNNVLLNALTNFSIPGALVQHIDWGDGRAQSFTGNKSFSHHYASNGHYLISLSSVAGACRDTFTKYVQIDPLPLLSVSAAGFCLGDQSVLAVSSLAAVLNWTINDSALNRQEKILELRLPQTGAYKALVTVKEGACIAADSVLFAIHALPLAAFTYLHNGMPGELQFKFINRSKGANIWDWQFDHSGTSHMEHPEYVFGQAGFKTVRLISSNSNICFDTVEMQVPVFGEIQFFLPGAFSPDQNFINDGFGLSQAQIVFVKNFNMSIYNRWGENIFVSDNPSEAWQAVGCPEGVYLYQAEIRDIYNILHIVKGTVTVLR